MVALMCCLILFFGVVSIIGCVIVRRVLENMRKNPEAAELIAKYVIAPLLSGGTVEEAKEVFGGSRGTPNQGRPS